MLGTRMTTGDQSLNHKPNHLHGYISKKIWVGRSQVQNSVLARTFYPGISVKMFPSSCNLCAQYEFMCVVHLLAVHLLYMREMWHELNGPTMNLLTTKWKQTTFRLMTSDQMSFEPKSRRQFFCQWPDIEVSRKSFSSTKCPNFFFAHLQFLQRLLENKFSSSFPSWQGSKKDYLEKYPCMMKNFIPNSS